MNRTRNWCEPNYKLQLATIEKLVECLTKINALLEIAACHNFHLNTKESMEFFFSCLLDYSQQALETSAILMKEKCLCDKF